MSTRITSVQSGVCFLGCLGIAVCMLSSCATVHHRHAVPSVSVEKSTYAPGENIVVNFSNGPGNRYDWIAIYNDGVKPGSGIFTRCWYYTDGTHDTGKRGVRDGSVVFDSASDNPENTERDWPLADGDYDIYLLCCDDYGILAGPVEFTIDSGGRD